jgi:DNA-directed RNA polymerase specialized sigma24 family protein
MKHGAANMPTPELQEFFAKIQGSDEAAVQAMLQEMDPFLRRVIRMRLLDGRLRRTVDTTDILQSLLKDFLRQPAAGDPAETSSAKLCAYLAAAVRHKVQTKWRKERRHAGSLPEECEPASPEPDVGKHVDDQDFAAAIRSRLDESARLLFDLRAHGLTWQEVAAKVSGRADALRMRLNRSVAVALTELEDKG